MLQTHDPRLMTLRDALAGQVLRGSGGISYHLRERIGEGGQGWVFKAGWDEPAGFVVIVKVLRPDAVTPETLQRFRREAEVLRMLGQQQRPNPHIVRFFDHATTYLTPPAGGDVIPLPFTVLEYVHGPTLEQVMRDARGMGLPVERARRIARHVAVALEQVHAQKIVHRDLKPSNILLANDGASEVAKVTDFGLVKLVDVNLQKTTALAGASLGYAPPEQYEQGNQRVSARTDAFSLATIVFEMLSGKPAFPYVHGENPLLIITRILNGPRPQLARTRESLPQELQMRPDLVERFDAVIARATSADPDQRHDSVGALWQALDPIFRSFAADVRRSFTPAPSSAMRASVRPPGGVPVPPDSSTSAPVSTRETPAVAGPSFSETQASNPASWRWRILAPAQRAGALTSVVFAGSRDVVYGIGAAGFVTWNVASGWSQARLPSAIDPRAVRGLRWANGELVIMGERGLAGRVASSGAYELWNTGFSDAILLGAHVAEGGLVTLVGERPSSSGVGPRASAGTIGVVVQVVGHRLLFGSEAPWSVRLRAVTRLKRGTMLACGDWGSVVRIEGNMVDVVGAVCGGHLHAIEATADGGALTVGAGGHALVLTPRLEAQLEAVQTTRDLLALSISAEGTAWAGSAQARVLRRSSGSWLRMSGELGVAGSVVALHAQGPWVRAACDDGTILEGSLA